MPATFSRNLFLLVVTILIWPLLVSAQAANLVFISNPQNIKPNEISEVITIQLQDSTGASFKATETIDVEFASNSATGEFLSPSSENPVTKTISTNSSNKNFRYRDSTQGNFTITVKAKGRVSGQELAANQLITISSQFSGSASTTNGETLTTTSIQTPNSNNQSSASTVVSAHFTALPLTNKKTEIKFEVGAGRNRLGTVGTPMEFKAESNKEFTRRTIYKWSFGDGSTGEGETVTHAYQYPGEYIVVLNAQSSEGRAVSRSNVKIIPPEISITHASPERIEISNNSTSEVNLYGRALVSGKQVFVFPEDTLIIPKQKISFSSEVTGLVSADSFNTALMIVGTQASPEKIAIRLEEERLDKIAQINAEIISLQSVLAQLPTQSHSINPVETQRTDMVEDNNIEVIQVASVNQAVTGTTSSSFRSWLNNIKRFFLWQR